MPRYKNGGFMKPAIVCISLVALVLAGCSSTTQLETSQPVETNSVESSPTDTDSQAEPAANPSSVDDTSDLFGEEVEITL